MCRILPYDAAARKSGDFQVFRCSAGRNEWGGRLRNTEFELNRPGFGPSDEPAKMVRAEKKGATMALLSALWRKRMKPQ